MDLEEEDLPSVDELWGELEYTTSHYSSHLMQSLEIIGYKHPDDEVRAIARDYYFGLTNMLHLNPENEEQLNKRLEDSI